MGVAIYYSAHRESALTDDERDEVRRLIETYDADRFIDAGGERFHVYADGDLAEGQVLAGATKLPLEEDSLFDAAIHWSALVGAIRRAVPDARWHVHIDDHELVWDTGKREYDLSM